MFSFFNGAVQHEYHKKLVALGGYATWDTQFAGAGGGGGESYSSGETQGTLLYTLVNPDTDRNTTDYFGNSEMEFSPSGEYLAVGAYLADNATTDYVGELHLYDTTTGTLQWTVESDTRLQYFGKEVDITNNYVFTGHERLAVGGTSNVGKVTVFDIADGSLVATINPSANTTNRYFGLALCTNPSTDQLAVYEGGTDTIYIYSSSDYTSVVTTISNAAGSTAVGECELDGDANYFALGNSNGDIVKVYDWSGNLQATITESGGYKFGFSVNLNGDYLAVGDNGYSDGNDGRVFVYSTSDWSLDYYKTYESVSSLFGNNVDTSSGYMTVGAPWVNAGGQYHSGAAYLYDLSDGSLLETITPTTSVRNAQFGIETAIDQYRYAIGERSTNKIYVYSTGN